VEGYRPGQCDKTNIAAEREIDDRQPTPDIGFLG
jgi:hypothetical protein